MFGGKSMGGGGGGGGNLLRSVGRAVTRVNVAGGALQEPLSSSSSSNGGGTTTTTSPPRNTRKPSSSNNLSLSSSPSTSSPLSPFAPCNIPFSSTSGIPTWSSRSHCDEFDWVSVDGIEDDGVHGVADDFFLGPVPSLGEVQTTVSAFQQVFNPAYSQFVRDKFVSESGKDVGDQVTSPTSLVQRVSSVGSELDWVEPSLHLCNSKMVQPHGYDTVYDAFHLLQTDTSVQRMVISLSSDKAVWDAVLNNEVVRELRESFYAAQENSSQNPDETPEDSNKATNIIKWIFDNTKSKVMQVIDIITRLVGDLLQLPENHKTTAGNTELLFSDKLRTSFMLSIVVLLVVVVGRAQKA
ncbi:hypothetical protein FNV43_RR24270 [Rhamnella rubrinervis]|uniref:Uncharacterized protein n=1 Tax=Rhamnella rubrinervis TaxID=2594499 RepID=A0A8K0GQK2_9ROSA|nr:hypothetical protein FNV43_RR24270 [Rhamnella rubrinervis]